MFKLSKKALLRKLEETHFIGFLNEKQYNLIYNAINTEGFEVSFESRPTKERGTQIVWTINFEKTIE